MKPKPLSHPLFAVLLFAILFAGFFAEAASAAEQLWTCGMHPQIIKTEPGNCPICGMKLVPIVDKGGAAAGTINIDPVTIQRMNLKTGLVTQGPVLREIRTVGTVAYDEAGLQDITTKYEGWIEKLFVNTTWTAVQAGDPLFEIYSPDLYNAELNFLVALKTEGEAGGPLSRAALARLQLFDVPADFIADLQSSREAKRTFTFRAPTAGIVIEKMAVAGQMIKPGERIYRLADLSHVWVEAQIYEQDLPFVSAGQAATVRVTYGPEREIEGRVDLLLPQVEEQTRTATARIVLPNSDGSLRPGMFVDVRFAAQIADDAVLVPDLAVLRSGEHNTVFIANADGSFEPRDVRLGVRSQGNVYQVLEGLKAGERVVTSGQFMLDSESQLRDAIQKMIRASGAASADSKAVQPVPENVGSAPLRPAGNPAIGMDDMSMLPADARLLLKNVALATIAGGDALAADDFEAYRHQLPLMRQALAAFLAGYERAKSGPLGAFKDALPDRTDVKDARRDFAYFSTAVADLVRANRLQQTEGFHIFQCPMAPGIGTGRWMQSSAKLKNPFYGSAMLDCGDEIK